MTNKTEGNARERVYEVNMILYAMMGDEARMSPQNWEGRVKRNDTKIRKLVGHAGVILAKQMLDLINENMALERVVARWEENFSAGKLTAVK